VEAPRDLKHALAVLGVAVSSQNGGLGVDGLGADDCGSGHAFAAGFDDVH